MPCHSPRDLYNPGIKHRSPTLQVDSLPAEPPGKPEAVVGCIQIVLHCTSDQGLLTTPRAAATSTGPANTTVHCSAYLLFCPSPDTTIQHQHSTLEKKLSPQHIRCVGLYLHGIQVLYHWIPGSYIN